MEIGSINSSQFATTIANAQDQPRTRQLGPDLQTQQAVLSRRNGEESVSALQESSDVESNRPTININGQIVGTRINTTA